MSEVNCSNEINMDPLQKQMLDDVFDAFTMVSGGNLVTLMHVEGGFTRYTKSAVELFGLPGEYIPNGAMDWTDWVHPEDRKRYLDVMMPLTTGETQTYDLTYRVRTVTGDYISFRLVGAVLRGEAGKPSLIGGVMFNEGVVEKTDPVTILPNKNALTDDLSEYLRARKNVKVLQIGVSGLARLNQVHGYTFGNRILQETGWIIQECAGNRGKTYRLDGSKFMFVTDSMTDQAVAALYDAVQMKLQRGVRIGTVRSNLSTNGGMLSTGTSQMDVDTLFSSVSFAYSESKNRKHGELVNYNGASDEAALGDLTLLSRIRSSILDGCTGFYLEYQPVFDVQEQRYAGVEALVRWRDESHGVVYPEAFLPVFEQDYIYDELGGWILSRAMTDGLEFLARDPSILLGVNISPAQLADEYFLDSLDMLLKSTGFPAGNLCLELTAGCRSLDTVQVSASVKALRELGVQIVLDDFGAGADSLTFLDQLNPEVVKFDRRMIAGIEREGRKRQALLHMVHYAALYDTNVCIKGVENLQQQEILSKLPVRSLQGHFYAKTVTPAEIPPADAT